MVKIVSMVRVKCLENCIYPLTGRAAVGGALPAKFSLFQLLILSNAHT